MKHREFFEYRGKKNQQYFVGVWATFNITLHSIDLVANNSYCFASKLSGSSYLFF